MWVIDEYAMIFFSDSCLNPMMPPTKAFIDEIVVINIFLFIIVVIYKMIKSGAIFCHVNKRKQLIHEIIFMVIGSQKWHGAIPIFIKIDRINSK